MKHKWREQCPLCNKWGSGVMEEPADWQRQVTHLSLFLTEQKVSKTSEHSLPSLLVWSIATSFYTGLSRKCCEWRSKWTREQRYFTKEELSQLHLSFCISNSKQEEACRQANTELMIYLVMKSIFRICKDPFLLNLLEKSIHDGSSTFPFYQYFHSFVEI